jgi:anti-sigma B factor antagonist
MSTCEALVRRHGDAVVVDLRGDIDGGARVALDTAYSEAAAAEATRVVLGFRDVDYINSTGIALLVGLLARARRDGRPVAAHGLSDHYREIFAITRLTDFVQVTDDETAALAGAAVATD